MISLHKTYMMIPSLRIFRTGSGRKFFFKTS